MSLPPSKYIRPIDDEHFIWLDGTEKGCCHVDDWPVQWGENTEVCLLVPTEWVISRTLEVPESIANDTTALKYFIEEQIASDPKSLHLVQQRQSQGQLRINAVAEGTLVSWQSVITNHHAKLTDILTEAEALNLVESQLILGPTCLFLDNGVPISLSVASLERLKSLGQLSHISRILLTDWARDQEDDIRQLFPDASITHQDYANLLHPSLGVSMRVGMFATPFPWLEVFHRVKWLAASVLAVILVQLLTMALDLNMQENRVTQLRADQLSVFRTVSPQGAAQDPYRQLAALVGNTEGLEVAKINRLIATVAPVLQNSDSELKRLELDSVTLLVKIYVETSSFEQLDRLVRRLAEAGVYAEVETSQARGATTTATILIEEDA